MLGVRGVKRGGAAYYLQDAGAELPRTTPPHWSGAAGARLGLEGPVDPVGLGRLLQGRNPRSDAPLGSGRSAVGAFDLTFSAPKSVSVVFGLGGVDLAGAVLDAHRDAVAAALEYLEDRAVTAVRQSGGERVVLPTTGMVAAQFTHGINRNGDPHLHTHVVMANLVHGSDGRWSACDRRGIEAHRSAAAAVYGAHLRARTSAVTGVRWAAGPGRPPEFAGVPQVLLGEFSSRRADIRRSMLQGGARSRRGSRVAWAVTRPDKERPRSFGELSAAWEVRARAAGGQVDLTARESHGPAVFDEHRYAAALSVGSPGGPRRADVVAALAGAAIDGIDGVSLDRIVDNWAPKGPVGVGEPRHPPRAVVPAGHLLRALGARPLDPAAHAVWVGAAREIEGYRRRWGLTDAVQSLGTTPLPTMPPARLAEHVRLTRDLRHARTRLGWREPVDVSLSRGR